jgi:hypothetical protein
MRLHGHLTTTVPKKYETAMSQLVTGSVSIPWQHVLPRDQFSLFFKKLVQETQDRFSELSFDYYMSTWTAGSRVLSSLKPAKIDIASLDRCLDVSGHNTHALESFRPKRSGFAHPVSYDRFSTRTGRLTVSEGPNILVLKKECRNSIVSSFEEGAVVSLDFRALEPRIVLAEAGRHSDSVDIYDDMSSTLFDGKISRDTVKVAVLAELYGISRSSLRTRLGVTDGQLDVFVDAIRRHFGTESLKNRLRNQFESTGYITNRFGRRLNVPAGQDNLFVNTYAQSSGVDVAMLGFDAVLRRLGSDGVRPLFVLHDAVILDVRGDRMKDAAACTSVSVPTYAQSFPLKFEVIS